MHSQPAAKAAQAGSEETKARRQNSNRQPATGLHLTRELTQGAAIRRLSFSLHDNPGMELLFVSLASALAGFVDSIVGGGGLVLVPALFAAFPTTHPATLFGINKSASVWGTALATVQYSRRVRLRWHALWPAAAAVLPPAAGFWSQPCC